MMEIIRGRRSARRFLERPLDGQIVELFKEALLRAPTSKNSMPSEFIIVDDRAILKALSECKANGSSFLEGAPMAVVVVADEAKSDVWVEDCSIAAITLQYLAESLGLGSCWIQVRRRLHSKGITSETHVRKVLGVPENLRVACIVAVGHRDGEAQRLSSDRFDKSKIRTNGY